MFKWICSIFSSKKEEPVKEKIEIVELPKIIETAPPAIVAPAPVIVEEPKKKTVVKKPRVSKAKKNV